MGKLWDRITGKSKQKEESAEPRGSQQPPGSQEGSWASYGSVGEVRYSQNTAELVIAMWLYGVMEFNGHPEDQVLADMFCLAMRDMILDEMEQVTRSESAVIASILDRVQPPLPVETTDAFRNLNTDNLRTGFQTFREMAIQRGVTMPELVDALEVAREIAKKHMK